VGVNVSRPVGRDSIRVKSQLCHVQVAKGCGHDGGAQAVAVLEPALFKIGGFAGAQRGIALAGLGPSDLATQSEGARAANGATEPAMDFVVGDVALAVDRACDEVHSVQLPERNGIGRRKVKVDFRIAIDVIRDHPALRIIDPGLGHRSTIICQRSNVVGMQGISVAKRRGPSPGRQRAGQGGINDFPASRNRGILGYGGNDLGQAVRTVIFKSPGASDVVGEAGQESVGGIGQVFGLAEVGGDGFEQAGGVVGEHHDVSVRLGDLHGITGPIGCPLVKLDREPRVMGQLPPV